MVTKIVRIITVITLHTSFFSVCTCKSPDIKHLPEIYHTVSIKSRHFYLAFLTYLSYLLTIISYVFLFTRKMDFYELVNLMARLRSREGCPWDRARSISDLRPYIMEEAMELIEAIDSGDENKIKEELGDLLFEIIFVSRIEEEGGKFDINDVTAGIGKKMIERHPHVFGNKSLSTPKDVEKSWEEIKAKGREGNFALDNVSQGLPALTIAEKYGKLASDKGFDWDNIGGVFDKIEEEIGELKEALGSGDFLDIEEEVGDILFSVVNLARFIGVNPELSLRKTNRSFYQRFEYVSNEVKTTNKSLNDMDIDELEHLWAKAKRREKEKK